jgi:hypothetical protein
VFEQSLNLLHQPVFGFANPQEELPILLAGPYHAYEDLLRMTDAVSFTVSKTVEAHTLGCAPHAIQYFSSILDDPPILRAYALQLIQDSPRLLDNARGVSVGQHFAARSEYVY